ncbi:MAG: hypothetical protein JNM55_20400 [Anaerolineales bacterium]|nr:hypothetical protein [Anaerolineales bacterium]
MKRTWFILIAVFLSSCGQPAASASTDTPPRKETPSITETPLTTVTPVCISPEPTQEDIDAALSYTEDVFASTDWEQSQAVGEQSVSVTWQNIPQSAVVFLEAVIFPCGYEEPDLNYYLSDDHWDALFANYDSYEMTGECETNDGLRLYQFEAASQGFDYNISYWSENDTNERIITTMITFPFGSEEKLDEYSIELFPELPNCS